jgi:hypothetical protein
MLSRESGGRGQMAQGNEQNPKNLIGREIFNETK